LTSRFLRLASVSLLWLCLIGSVRCEISISEISIPTANSLPSGVSVWRGQTVFFCESARAKIGVLDVSSGAIKELDLPSLRDDPVAVSADSAGLAWVVTNLTNSVIRVNSSSGELKSWAPQVHEGFSDIKVAANGLIWLANRAGMSVGTLDVNTGLIKEFSAQGMKPFQIAVDMQRVWFTDPDDDKVAFLVPDTLNLTTFTLSRGSKPTAIALDERGFAWVALLGLNQILEINPGTSETTSRNIPTPGGGVYGIAVAPDGSVWFTEALANKIGRFDRGRDELTEFMVPTPSSFPTSITVGPDGRAWFVEETGNKLGSVTGAATLTSSTGSPSQGPEGLSSATLWLIVAVAAVGCAAVWAYYHKRKPKPRQQAKDR